MAATNPLTLLLRRGDSVFALPAVPKSWSGGNNLSKTSVCRLDFAGAGALFGHRLLPTSLDNTAAIKFQALVSVPVSGAAGEKLRLEVGYNVAGDGQAADFAAWTQSLVTSFAINTWVAKNKMLVEWTATQANFIAAKQLEFYLKRDSGHVDDNYGGAIFIHQFWLLCNY